MSKTPAELLRCVAPVALLAIALRLWWKQVIDPPYKVYLPSKAKTTKLLVLVTGCSTGIGYDAALFLATKGYTVYATVRKQSDFDKLQESAKTLGGSSSGALIPIFMDVTKQTEVDKAADLISTEVSKGSVLVGIVNNAGVEFDAFCEAVDIDAAKRLFDVNLFGVMRVTKAFLPLLRQCKGRVVTIGSLGGMLSLLVLGSYCASKFAIEGYNDTLRREMRLLGVPVILIQPGFVKSALTEHILSNTAITTGLTDTAKEEYAPLIKIVNRQKLNGASPSNLWSPRVTTSPLIYKALTEKRPKTRYMTAGYGIIPASGLKFIARGLPDKLGDFVLLNI